MSKEFGSRADMLSAKIDEVSRNSIWREHCNKEKNVISPYENFSIANSDKMSVFSEKPNRIRFDMNVTEQKLAESKSRLDEMCLAKDSLKLPVERHSAPATSSQEYGWHSTIDIKVQGHKVDHSHKSCEITRIADKYFKMAGMTPFSKREDVS